MLRAVRRVPWHTTWHVLTCFLYNLPQQRFSSRRWVATVVDSSQRPEQAYLRVPSESRDNAGDGTKSHASGGVVNSDVVRQDSRMRVQNAPVFQLPKNVLHLLRNLISQRRQKPLVSIVKNIRSHPLLSQYLCDRDQARAVAENLACSDTPSLALDVLILARMLGCEFKSNAYECVAYRLVHAKEWSHVLATVKLAKKHGCKLTVRLLNYRILALLKSGNYFLLSHILKDFDAMNLKPTRRTFHLLLTGCLYNRNLKMAKECMQNMEDAGFPPDASTDALILSAYGSFGPDKEVQERALEHLPTVGGATAVNILNDVLRLCIRARDRAGVQKTVTWFDSKMLEVDLAFISGGNSILPGGESLPSHLHNANPTGRLFTPNTKTYYLLAKYLIEQGEPRKAWNLLEQMAVKSITPDSGTAAVVVCCLCAMRDVGSATLFVAKLCRSQGVDIAHPAFHHFISNRTSLLSSLFRGVCPSINVFNSLLKGLLPLRGFRGARYVIDCMKLCGIKADTATIQIITSYLERRRRATPRVLMRFLRASALTGSAFTLGQVLVIFRRVLRAERRSMRSAGWLAVRPKPGRLRKAPTRRPSYSESSLDPTSGIDPSEFPAYRDILAPMVQSLRDRGVKSSNATFAMRIQREATVQLDIQSAFDMLELMMSRGIHPTRYHFSALMQGYTQIHDLISAEKIMTAAVDAGIKPDRVMFTILIAGHARNGSPESALRTFQSMMATGIQPDRAAVDALASSYFAVRNYKMARRILLTLWHHVLPAHQPPYEDSLKDIVTQMRTLRNTYTADAGTRNSTPLIARKRRTLMKELKILRGQLETIQQQGIRAERSQT